MYGSKPIVRKISRYQIIQQKTGLDVHIEVRVGEIERDMVTN